MRSLLLAALAFALVLPGCATTDEGLASAKLDGAAAAADLHFGKPVAMSQPTGGAEPNIAVGKDGSLWIAAVAGSQERPNALQGAAWLWHSKDNGTTWETVRAPMRETPLGSAPATRKPFGSSDADVVVAPDDGTVYYTDWWIARGPVGAPVGLPVSPGNYLVERSADGGASWQSSPITTIDAATSVDRQWLVAGPKGFVGLFYAYFHPAQNAARIAGDPFQRGDQIMSIQAVFSTDHGASWSNPITVVDPLPDRSYEIAHPRLLPDGTLWMPYADVGPGTDFWTNSGEVRVVVSANNGTSWRPRTVAQVPFGFDNLWAVQGASDDTGRMVVAWAARSGQTMTLFEAESSDHGDSWSAPVALRSAGLNFLPWVAAKDDGATAIGWYGSAPPCEGAFLGVQGCGQNVTGDPTKVAKETAWYPYVATRAQLGDAFQLGLASPEPVKLGPMCPKGAACTSDREELDYLSLAFKADGSLGIAFAKSRDVNGAKAGQVHFALRP